MYHQSLASSGTPTASWKAMGVSRANAVHRLCSALLPPLTRLGRKAALNTVVGYTSVTCATKRVRKLKSVSVPPRGPMALNSMYLQGAVSQPKSVGAIKPGGVWSGGGVECGVSKQTIHSLGQLLGDR